MGTYSYGQCPCAQQGAGSAAEDGRVGPHGHAHRFYRPNQGTLADHGEQRQVLSLLDVFARGWGAHGHHCSFTSLGGFAPAVPGFNSGALLWAAGDVPATGGGYSGAPSRRQHPSGFGPDFGHEEPCPEEVGEHQHDALCRARRERSSS